MRKHYLFKPFLIGLVTAFLFLQWSATHIHLAGEHEHSEGSHQHTVTSHQHQLTTYHADAIDVAADTLSHSDSNKVVELEYVCTQFHGKLGELLAVIPSEVWNSSERQEVFSKSIAPFFQQDTYQTYHQYTSLRLRAPPALS